MKNKFILVFMLIVAFSFFCGGVKAKNGNPEMKPKIAESKVIEAQKTTQMIVIEPQGLMKELSRLRYEIAKLQQVDQWQNWLCGIIGAILGGLISGAITWRAMIFIDDKSAKRSKSISDENKKRWEKDYYQKTKSELTLDFMVNLKNCLKNINKLDTWKDLPWPNYECIKNIENKTESLKILYNKDENIIKILNDFSDLHSDMYNTFKPFIDIPISPLDLILREKLTNSFLANLILKKTASIRTDKDYEKQIDSYIKNYIKDGNRSVFANKMQDLSFYATANGNGAFDAYIIDYKENTEKILKYFEKDI